MSNLADALRPVRELTGTLEQPALLRPVSRISFTLTDSKAFQKAARFAVEWLADKAGGVLPPEAMELQSFDTRGIEGYHPCHVVRVNDPSGSIWASRIDEPGARPEANVTWSTELFVEARASKLVRFGAQLMARGAAWPSTGAFKPPPAGASTASNSFRRGGWRSNLRECHARHLQRCGTRGGPHLSIWSPASHCRPLHGRRWGSTGRSWQTSTAPIWDRAPDRA